VSQRSIVTAVCSKLYPVVAAGVLVRRRGSLWCWYVRRASGFCGVIGISLIEKNYDKKRNGLVGYERAKNEV